MKTEILIVGDSHIMALGVPTLKPGEPARLVQIEEIDGFQFTGVAASGLDKRSYAYWSSASQFCGARHVAISWKGNQYNQSFLFRSTPVFDFFGSAQGDAISEDAVLVPRSVIKEFFSDSFGRLGGVVRQLREAGADQIILLGTPGPKSGDEAMLRVIRRSPRFRAMAETSGIDLASADCLTPLAIRIKLWAVLQDMIAAEARKLGCIFLPVPPDTLAPDGSLLELYWAGDVTHANANYGSIVRRQIMDCLAARKIREASTA